MLQVTINLKIIHVTRTVGCKNDEGNRWLVGLVHKVKSYYTQLADKDQGKMAVPVRDP